MFPCEISTDSKPPVGASGAIGASGVSVEDVIPGATSLTKTTGVLNLLMINVAVSRGVGVLVRVGVCVMVGELDAVGLGVKVLVGAGFGLRFRVEQASRRITVENSTREFRISTSL